MRPSRNPNDHADVEPDTAYGLHSCVEGPGAMTDMLHWLPCRAVIAPGVVFRITGPCFSPWTPGKVGGWQPAAWSHHPFDEASQKIRVGDTFINFGDTFTVLQSGEFGRFRSARVALPLPNPVALPRRAEVWINTAKFQRGRWTAWVAVQPTQPQNEPGSSSNKRARLIDEQNEPGSSSNKRRIRRGAQREEKRSKTTHQGS